MTAAYLHHWRTKLFLPIAAASVLTPGMRTASAQDTTAVHDTFVWDSAASDDVAAAIKAALADLESRHSQFAVGHLRSAVAPYRTVTIEQDEETISIALDNAEPIHAPVNGQPVEWVREDGKRMRVSVARVDDAIRQTFAADNEERENLFRPSADGRGLTMTVTVRMDRLPSPVRYDAVYRRNQTSRARQYLWRLAGPATVVGTVVAAGFDQLLDVPEDWNRDLDGYGRRVASRWGRFAVQTTVTHGLAAALNQPMEYQSCGCSGRGRRVGHALLGTVTDRGSDGGRRPALPRVAGIYAGAFADLAFNPGDSNVSDALVSGTSWIATSALANLLQEFLGARIPLFGAKIKIAGHEGGPGLH